MSSICNLLSYWYGILFNSFLSTYLILYLFTEICLFIQVMRFSPQVFWSGLPFPPPVYHVLSELSTMPCQSWVALQDVAHTFIELPKPLCHNKAVICEGSPFIDHKEKRV